jgi:integrase
LAYNLGQREGDVLALAWSQYTGEVIRMRQGKTKVLLDVPVIAELRGTLEAAEKKSPTMVVSETTQRPYKVHNFTHRFAEIRDAAGLRHLQFRDLRRSAVVALAEAGCEIPEISAITGHSLTRCVAILETYLPRNSVMARNAVTKLSEYRQKAKVGSRIG